MANSASDAAAAVQHVKALGLKDIVLFTVSAILLLDTLAAGAAVGSSSVFWWLFLGVVFFVPYALICSEMGTTYPEQGGLYAWIRRAYGRRWASRATWAYWINTAVWNPAIFILFAGIFSQLFVPDLPLGGVIAIGLVLTWVSVLINVVALDVGKWVPNVGAVLKLLIIAAIIVGAVLHSADHGMANALTWDAIRPSWGSSLAYLSVIVYGMLGFELVSAGGDEMKDPHRDVPRAILISGAIIIGMYTLATIAILSAIPAADIDLVEGLVDTLHLFFGASGPGGAFATLLGIGALYTFFSNGVTWSLGCNRAIAEAAAEGEFPQLLARLHTRNKTPVGAAVALGVSSTVILLLYGFMSGTNEDLFWTLFAFSAVIFMAPYVVLVLAFRRLRFSDPSRVRPFRVPGGNGVASALAWLCAFVLLVTIALFCYTPGGGEGGGIQWPIVVGAAVVLAIGEVIIRMTESSRNRVPDAA